jgi:transcription elongation GreA/GreB family factor
MSKPALIARFRALLEERLRTVEASLADARGGMRVDGCFKGNNRCERAAITSHGYLAAGLGRRAEEIKASLELLEQVDPGPRDQISPGAWVVVADAEGEERAYLLLPGGQGDRLEGPDGPVTVISPGSPLARSLRGLREGDEVPVLREGRQESLEILELR